MHGADTERKRGQESCPEPELSSTGSGRTRDYLLEDNVEELVLQGQTVIRYQWKCQDTCDTLKRLHLWLGQRRRRTILKATVIFKRNLTEDVPVRKEVPGHA